MLFKVINFISKIKKEMFERLEQGNCFVDIVDTWLDFNKKQKIVVFPLLVDRPLVKQVAQRSNLLFGVRVWGEAIRETKVRLDHCHDHCRQDQTPQKSNCSSGGELGCPRTEGLAV